MAHGMAGPGDELQYWLVLGFWYLFLFFLDVMAVVSLMLGFLLGQIASFCTVFVISLYFWRAQGCRSFFVFFSLGGNKGGDSSLCVCVIPSVD